MVDVARSRCYMIKYKEPVKKAMGLELKVETDYTLTATVRIRRNFRYWLISHPTKFRSYYTSIPARFWASTLTVSRVSRGSLSTGSTPTYR